MDEIKIINETGGQHGTLLFLNGVEVPNLALVGLHAPAGKRAEVRADILVYNNFEIDMTGAEVLVSMKLTPGWQLVSEERDGRTIYRSELDRDALPPDDRSAAIRAYRGLCERYEDLLDGLGPLNSSTDDLNSSTHAQERWEEAAKEVRRCDPATPVELP